MDVDLSRFKSGRGLVLAICLVLAVLGVLLAEESAWTAVCVVACVVFVIAFFLWQNVASIIVATGLLLAVSGGLANSSISLIALLGVWGSFICVAPEDSFERIKSSLGERSCQKVVALVMCCLIFAGVLVYAIDRGGGGATLPFLLAIMFWFAVFFMSSPAAWICIFFAAIAQVGWGNTALSSCDTWCHIWAGMIWVGLVGIVIILMWTLGGEGDGGAASGACENLKSNGCRMIIFVICLAVAVVGLVMISSSFWFCVNAICAIVFLMLSIFSSDAAHRICFAVVATALCFAATPGLESSADASRRAGHSARFIGYLMVWGGVWAAFIANGPPWSRLKDMPGEFSGDRFRQLGAIAFVLNLVGVVLWVLAGLSSSGWLWHPTALTAFLTGLLFWVACYVEGASYVTVCLCWVVNQQVGLFSSGTGKHNSGLAVAGAMVCWVAHLMFAVVLFFQTDAASGAGASGTDGGDEDDEEHGNSNSASYQRQVDQ